MSDTLLEKPYNLYKEQGATLAEQCPPRIEAARKMNCKIGLHEKLKTMNILVMIFYVCGMALGGEFDGKITLRDIETFGVSLLGFETSLFGLLASARPSNNWKRRLATWSNLAMLASMVFWLIYELVDLRQDKTIFAALLPVVVIYPFIGLPCVLNVRAFRRPAEVLQQERRAIAQTPVMRS